MVRSISVGHSIIQRRCLHLINIIVANSWEDHYNSSERVRGCLAYSGISKHTGNSNLRLKTPNFICVHTDVKVQVHGYASAYGGKRESVFLSYFTVLFWHYFYSWVFQVLSLSVYLIVSLCTCFYQLEEEASLMTAEQGFVQDRHWLMNIAEWH